MARHQDIFAACLASFLCIGAAATWAADGIVAPVILQSRPWEDAQAVLSATEADVFKNGSLLVIGNHEQDLIRTLANAPQSFAIADGNGTTYVLTDGQQESAGALAMGLFASLAVPNKGQKNSIVAVVNPYPGLSFYLGSYYNEIGKHEDALRVLDAALASPARFKKDSGDHLPSLVTERGAALLAMKRYPEALEGYQNGLTIKNLADIDRARMLRGCGFALTELGRLDDAEQSYRDSLEAEPNNALAKNELAYIAKLRAGASPTSPGQLVAPALPKPPPLPAEKSL
jgi:tetratricopeptide (TPR) repeat protein